MPHPTRRALVSVVATGALVTSMAVGVASASPGSPSGTSRAVEARQTQVQLLSFNDFHGHLEANDPPLSRQLDPSQTPVGGVAHLSAALTDLRQHVGDRNSLTVSAGDNVGGSTFLSGLFRDEPTIEALDALGLDVSSVGNHEFDEGTEELLRIQGGGCHPVDGCFLTDRRGRDIRYPGAQFDYLAANVVDRDSGEPLLPATTVRRIQGIPVGFIGATLEGTDTLVSPAGVSDVEFLDEVETINAQAAALQARGVEAIVVLLHEGGTQSGTFTQCTDLRGPIVGIAEQVDPAVDHIISGHTHQPYVCSIPDPAGQPRAVTSAASFGQVVTETRFGIDRRTRDVVRSSVRATNHLVTRDRTDPRQTAIVEKWQALAAPLAGRVVGRITEDITGDASGDRGIETPMANLVADSILNSTEGDGGGAELALTNVGGVRASLLVDQVSNGEQPGEVTFQEAYNVLPFGNITVSMDLTGDQVRQVLEQQYQPVPARGSRATLALGVSEGFAYSWDATAPQGSRVVAGSMRLNGAPMDMSATYRVGTLNFLASGGDLFTAFTQGRNVLGGPEDVTGFADYLTQNSPVSSPGADRVDGL